MKTIGVIGGVTWESTLEYYRIMNEAVKERLGGYHSPKVLLYSVNFDEVFHLQKSGNDPGLLEMMLRIARNLEGGGAECLVIAANTLHRLADEIESRISIPLLHIADATAEKIKDRKIEKVGLLGTKYTMEEDFYRRRLKERHGIETLVPDEEDRRLVHRVIMRELALGTIRVESREKYLEIMKKLVEGGAEGIILGCTEIPLLLRQEHTDIPVFDTTDIHARAAVDFALQVD